MTTSVYTTRLELGFLSENEVEIHCYHSPPEPDVNWQGSVEIEQVFIWLNVVDESGDDCVQKIELALDYIDDRELIAVCSEMAEYEHELREAGRQDYDEDRWKELRDE